MKKLKHLIKLNARKTKVLSIRPIIPLLTEGIMDLHAKEYGEILQNWVFRYLHIRKNRTFLGTIEENNAKMKEYLKNIRQYYEKDVNDIVAEFKEDPENFVKKKDKDMYFERLIHEIKPAHWSVLKRINEKYLPNKLIKQIKVKNTKNGLPILL